MNLDANHPTIFNLSNLDVLEELCFGDACCTSVNWLYLDLYSLQKLVVGMDSFTHCCHVWFDNLPSLGEWITLSNAFSMAALTIHCISIYQSFLSIIDRSSSLLKGNGVWRRCVFEYSSLHFTK